jgi:formylmethanofuran:tetrahydromethanopterin formyltransferase
VDPEKGSVAVTADFETERWLEAFGQEIQDIVLMVERVFTSIPFIEGKFNLPHEIESRRGVIGGECYVFDKKALEIFPVAMKFLLFDLKYAQKKES